MRHIEDNIQIACVRWFGFFFVLHFQQVTYLSVIFFSESLKFL